MSQGPISSKKSTSKQFSSQQVQTAQNAGIRGIEPELLEQLSEEDKKTAENLLREMQEEISPEAAPLWQFVNDNAPKIATAVIGLVLIIAGFAFYHGYQESALEKARIELATIISNPQEAQRLKALETFYINAPSELSVGINYEMARAALLSGDTNKAETCFLAVIAEEGKSALGVTASVNLADMYAKAQEAQKALDIYESIVNVVPSDMQVMVYLNIADIAAAANMNEKAITAFQKVIDSMPQTQDNGQDIEYFKARIQELS